MNRILVFLLYISLFGCSSPKKEQVPEQFRDLANLRVYSETVSPKARVTFTMERVFGDSGSTIIGKMGEIAVDSSDRVFIADVQSQSIQVFEPNGEIITQLGREGRGPNEFGYVKNVHVINDQLYVFDSNLNRATIYTLAPLNIKETVVLGRNRSDFQNLKTALPSIDALYVNSEGALYAKYILSDFKEYQKKEWVNYESKGILYQLNKKGEIQRDKYMEFVEDTRTSFPYGSVVLGFHIEPFFGKSKIVFNSKTSIFLVEPQNFLMKEFNLSGEYQKAFYYPVNKIPLTEELAIKAKTPELYIENMKSMNLPKSWPVVTEMKIDDQDCLWVATTVEDMSVYEWWVLEETGELISRFSWPRDEPVKYIRNGKMYTHQTDNESGMERIVRYRFELEEI